MLFFNRLYVLDLPTDKAKLSKNMFLVILDLPVYKYEEKSAC